MHPTRIFKTPEDLWKAFTEYKQGLIEESEKWLKVQYVGKEGDRVTDAQKIPLSMSGFYKFCWDNYGCVEQYFVNKDNLYDDFVSICSRIKNERDYDLSTGGLLNFYNPSLTQRILGLKESVEVDQVNKEVPLFPDETKDKE